MSVRRKKRPAAVALMTSMGDIAFLLIIFFILASIQKKNKQFTPPEAPGLDEIKGAITVTLDETGKCSVDGEDNVPIEALASRVRELLDKRKESKLVIVEIDRSITYEVSSKVLLAVSEAGGKIGAVGVSPGR